MASPQDEALVGAILEESTALTIAELSRLCAVEERRIIEYVEEGVLEVVAIDAPEWRFRGAALRRARMAVRLERDFELNLGGLALVMELLEELERLRRESRDQ
jgi:chaperone modulatory protein CbpM